MKLLNKVKSIAIDFDDVIYPTLDSALAIYNKLYNKNITVEDCKSWDLDKEIHDCFLRNVFVPFQSKNNAISVIKKLIDLGYEVYIVTASRPESFIKKYEYIRTSMPFFPLNNLVCCHKKGVLNTDILIDDGSHNLDSFKQIKICYDMPHNRAFYYEHRIKSLEDIFELECKE